MRSRHPDVLPPWAARQRALRADLGGSRLHDRAADRAALQGSIASTQPIAGDELRKLRKLHRSQEAGSRFLFLGERGPVVGSECGLPLVHPRMLRHACGFALADKRATCARSRTISAMPVKNTVVYTNLAPSRFDSIWD
jgi:hypothetical protein